MLAGIKLVFFPTTQPNTIHQLMIQELTATSTALLGNAIRRTMDLNPATTRSFHRHILVPHSEISDRRRTKNSVLIEGEKVWWIKINDNLLPN